MTTKAATIGKIRSNGSTYQMWTTTDHGGKSHAALLTGLVKTDKITEPGSYIVCSTNLAGMPIGSIFTVTRSPSGLDVASGVPLGGRVNRWPPKI